MTFKKHWAVLSSGVLYIFPSEKDGRVAGIVELMTVTDVKGFTDERARKDRRLASLFALACDF